MNKNKVVHTYYLVFLCPCSGEPDPPLYTMVYVVYNIYIAYYVPKRRCRSMERKRIDFMRLPTNPVGYNRYNIVSILRIKIFKKVNQNRHKG